MSEFCDSYHIRSNDIKDGVGLLERAGLTGFVYPQANGWVTLVAEGSEMMPNEDLIAVNDRTMLQFVSDEDFGYYFSVYEGGKLLSHYECIWEDNIEVNDRFLNMEVVLKFAKDRDEAAKQLNEILYPKTLDDLICEPSIPKTVAEVLGLPNVDWVSYRYLFRDYIAGEMPEEIARVLAQ